MTISQVIADDAKADTNRRFGGVYRLYGEDFAPHLLHVYVIGVGGVGSWVAEGLARTGVGEITLIDMDILVASNVNRQLPALTKTLGRSKIEVMGERLTGINPDICVHLVDDFLTKDNVADLLPSRQMVKDWQAQGRQVVVMDCTDDMNAKLAIALHCRFHKIKLVVSGGAGGKIDPSKISVADLKDVYQDPLLAKMRHRLRDRGINSQMREKFGIKCVFSTEPPKVVATCQSGLHCGGYGSAVAMTASMGMMMVAVGVGQVG